MSYYNNNFKQWDIFKLSDINWEMQMKGRWVAPVIGC